MALTKLTNQSLVDITTMNNLATAPNIVTDLSSVNADIGALALREATNEASAAFNLPNQFIETFTDDTNLATQTSVDRDLDGGGFVSSVYNSFGTQAVVADGTGTAIGNMTEGGGLAAAFDGTTSQTDSQGAKLSSPSQDNTTECYVGKDWGSGNTKFITGFKSWSSSNDGMSSSGNNVSGCSLILRGSNTNDFTNSTTLGTLGSLNFRLMSNEYSKLDVTRTSGYRYHWLQVRNGSSTACTNFMAELRFYEDPLTTTTNATGTLIQSANTVASAKTKVSGTILYKDSAGTATIGTDLKIYFSCNNGGAWTEAASYNAITPVYSTGIKQVRLGETTCTSGTGVIYKAVWANQSGAKATQLHGISINY